jgi:iron(II)-dependent oxidoreductase
MRCSSHNRSIWIPPTLFVLLLAASQMVVSDEWKPRHALLSPTGVMNLSEPPPPSEIFFSGPDDPSQSAAWLAGLRAWREDRLTKLRYDGAEYSRQELAWTQSSFSQVQVLIWDRTLYDAQKSQFTVDRFLAGVESRIGTIDSVLIWHVYPNLGVDDRNQFDMLRDLPGGIPALRDMVDEFHRRRVKVFFPVLAWDSGTREAPAAAAVTLSNLLKEIGADGINFDTLESVPRDFRAASDDSGQALALNPQFDIRDESLAWSNIGWNDWVTWEGTAYPFVPMVSKSKWLEPRHMVNVTDRFTRDKTDSLQHAFFNGQGYATLENLWGFWYGMTPHDAEAVLRFTRIERAFAENLSSASWEPHSPTLQYGVFASKFPKATRTLWTVINRNEYGVAGDQLRLGHQEGTRYYDLWRGVELLPSIRGGQATLSFPVDGLGFSAILATTETPLNPALGELLSFMQERSKRSLNGFSREWKPVQQAMTEIAPTHAAPTTPPGMVAIPAGEYDFQVRGIEIEGGNDPGVDVQYPWEDAPRRAHLRHMKMHAFFIDRTPVTNSEFKKFLDATNYQPKDAHNFLREWKDRNFPEGWARKPVTWVSIEDARAYASWAGKRLPHEWDWQYAAQSTDGRLYPWGNNWNSSALPPGDHARTLQPLPDVAAFPEGASVFGVLDLLGSVSQWTDEFTDAHTRAAVLRGGAAYQPRGSIWYFPQTYRLDEHQKYLLMSPGHDRSGTIGFRCIVDAQ